jgi:serine/threonine protein kinase
LTGRFELDKHFFKDDFEITHKLFASHTFVNKAIENEYRQLSAGDHIATVYKGIRVVLIFLTSFSILDLVMWLKLTHDTNAETTATILTLWPSPVPRLFVTAGSLSMIFVWLIIFLTESRLHNFFAKGHNVTRPFFILYLLVTICSASAWVVGGMVVGDVFKGPTLKEYSDGPMLLQSIVPYVLSIVRTPAGQYDIDRWADANFVPIAVEIGGTALVLFYVINELVLREIFGRLCRYTSLQLHVISFVQAGVIIFFLFHIQRIGAIETLTHRFVFPLFLIYVPALRTIRRNEKHDNESRARYVRWKIAAEEKEALRLELATAEKHLQDLHSKLQLTEAQMQMVKESTEGLQGMSGYKVDLETELTFQRKLGEGAYGVVYLAKFRGDTVAVKQLIADKVNKENMERFKSEILLLSTLHHPNICQILAAAWEAPNLAIVLEYAHHGDLQAFLYKYKERVKWGHGGKYGSRLKLILGVAQGMRYLHNRAQPIMHRDLKLENCLVTDFLVCKLSDFGESRNTDEQEGRNLTMVGTPFFIAPEVVNGDPYGAPCDVFSFAVLLGCIAIVDGDARKMFCEPFRKGAALTEVQKHRLKGMHISNKHAKGWRANLESFQWPEKMVDLIGKCWDGDASKRPTFDEIFAEVEEWDEEMFGELESVAAAPKVGFNLNRGGGGGGGGGAVEGGEPEGDRVPLVIDASRGSDGSKDSDGNPKKVEPPKKSIKFNLNRGLNKGGGSGYDHGFAGAGQEFHTHRHMGAADGGTANGDGADDSHHDDIRL